MLDMKSCHVASRSLNMPFMAAQLPATKRRRLQIYASTLYEDISIPQSREEMVSCKIFQMNVFPLPTSAASWCDSDKQNCVKVKQAGLALAQRLRQDAPAKKVGRLKGLILTGKGLASCSS